MAKDVIVIGAGGHAKVVADITLASGDTLAGFLDDNATGNVLGYPVLGTMHDLGKYSEKFSFVIGIGDNQTRKRIAEENALNWYTAIHPSAIAARDVSIGAGTVIMAGAIINPSAKIGRHCIINTAAVIEHDNVIEDYVHVSPHATLCGTVKIGELTHIGAGACVKNNVSVCGNCVVGAGSAVVKDIDQPGVYVGIPAKRLTK